MKKPRRPNKIFARRPTEPKKFLLANHELSCFDFQELDKYAKANNIDLKKQGYVSSGKAGLKGRASISKIPGLVKIIIDAIIEGRRKEVNQLIKTGKLKHAQSFDADCINISWGLYDFFSLPVGLTYVFPYENQNYDKELIKYKEKMKVFEKKLTIYEEEFKKYEINLRLYNAWKLKNHENTLKDQLKKIQNELDTIVKLNKK